MNDMLKRLNKYPTHSVLITDIENKIVWINKGFSGMTDYSMKECQGKSPSQLLYGNTTDQQQADFMWQRLIIGEEFEADMILFKKNGMSLLVRVQAQPIFDDAGSLMQHYIHIADISEQEKIISRAVYKAQEKIKAEIGGELHDNVNQLLASVNVYLKHLISYEERDVRIMQKCMDHTGEAIEEIRKMTKRFVSPISRQISFMDSLKDLIQQVKDSYKIDVQLKMEQFEETKINFECKQNLFRIVQEQLNNIAKHAMADFISIQIIMDTEGINLTIIDNGCGFDLKSHKKGVGMINIFQRAEAFNGKAEIISGTGKGCKLHVVIPIECSAA